MKEVAIQFFYHFKIHSKIAPFTKINVRYENLFPVAK